MSLYTFFQSLSESDTVLEIIDEYKTQSKKGYVFERLWDLVIKFGCCEHFPNSQYTHHVGNCNISKPKELKDLQQYIKTNNMISGNASGAADICLYDNHNQKWIFITSKYPKTSQDQKSSKSVKYYDVQDIVAMVEDNKHIYEDYEIFALVPDKTPVLKTIKRSNKSSNYITKHMKNILDLTDLEKAFQIFKQRIDGIDFDDINDRFCHKKDSLKLYFHQDMFTYKTLKLINRGEKMFLWGWKCRAGKTYGVGGLLKKAFKIYGSVNALIITPAPTETSPQFEEMFNEFIDFDEFNVHNIKSGKELKQCTFDGNNIVIVSKQLLQDYTNDKTIKPIKELKLDFIVFDENHYGGTTVRSKNIVESYSIDTTVKIFLTATFNKSIKEWNIPNDCQMYWDIEDEQWCKKRDIASLQSKHSEDVLEFVDEDKLDVLKSYDRMPDMVIISTMFDSERYEQIKTQIMDSKYGFSMEVLFSIKNKQFIYPNEVQKILRYISGSNKEIDFKFGDKSIFNRIKNISLQYDNRVQLDNASFTTQLWFLPFGAGMKIDDVSSCLKKSMENDKILKDFEIMIINSKVIDKIKDLKARITNKEIEAKTNDKRGLILLAGNQCSLGITLPLVDIVFLLNNTLSSDMILQMMYRCMSESADGVKKLGFVVDLNISRVLNTMLDYNTHGSNKNIEDKIKYIIENNLINIDPDEGDMTNKINKTKIVENLLGIWRSDPINNLKTLLKKIEYSVISIDNSDQKIINGYFTSSKSSKINLKVDFNEDDKQVIDSGKTIEKKDKDPIVDLNSSSHSDDEEIMDVVSFAKDVLQFIIPLSCILTINNNNKNDFIAILRTIKANPELIQVFNDQSLIWWNKKDIIDIVIYMVNKYIEKNSDVYNITIQFKMSLISLIDKPKELLELIDNCLKPKDHEKKTFGEVFTPMSTVNEMLDKLPAEVWTNKDLKWFDPASGMGNFPIAVYLRLNKSLEKEIPDTLERKKHILEKMLYMCELNVKNVFVCKQIFDLNNEYKLNIHNGDALKLDINKMWNVKKFDIIMGNPPYNEDFGKTNDPHAKPIYQQWVNKYHNKCSYMIYIIPSKWFASDYKDLFKLRKFLTSSNKLQLIVHYDDASKIFGNKVDIKGGVSYFLYSEYHNGNTLFNNISTDLKKYDIVVESQYYDILNTVEGYWIKNLSSLYKSQGTYNVASNDTRLSKNKMDGMILCYVAKNKGYKNYIDQKYINNDLNKHKIITTAAAHKGKSGFGNIFIGYENEIHNKSYISFDVDTLDEAKSLLSYLKCKLPNLLLSLRKITHNLTNSNIFKWIPLPPLDRIWTDDEVYEYFDMSEQQIQQIKKTHIVGYKDLSKKELSDSSSVKTPKIMTKRKGTKRKIAKKYKNERSSEESAEPVKITTKKRIVKVIPNPRLKINQKCLI